MLRLLLLLTVPAGVGDYRAPALPPLDGLGAVPAPAGPAVAEDSCSFGGPTDAAVEDAAVVELTERGSGQAGLDIRRRGQWVQISRPPGRYVLTGVGHKKRVEFTLPEEGTVRIAAVCLEVVAKPRTESVPLVARSKLDRGTIILGGALGRSIGESREAARVKLAGWVGSLIVHFALTDRLQWPTLPALAYQFDVGNFELIPWAGMYDWGFAVDGDNMARVDINFRPDVDFRWVFDLPDLQLTGYIGAGIDIRYWATSRLSFNFTTATTSAMQYAVQEASRFAPTSWRQHLALGVSYSMWTGTVTFNLGAAAAGNWLYEGKLPKVVADGKRFGFSFGFGSVIYRGIRKLPLIQVHLPDGFSIDVYASVDCSPYELANQGECTQTYMLGGSWAFVVAGRS